MQHVNIEGTHITICCMVFTIC